MKRLLAVCMLSLITCSVYGNSSRKDSHGSYHGHKNKPSIFDVILLNSPEKNSVAKFLLETPEDFEIDQVMFKVRNASELFIKENNYSLINLESGLKGKELHIPISNLKNGFYMLFVRVKTVEKIKPKYRYRNHDFKSAHHDFVRFVVEKKSVVQMPDSVKNDATIAGVDSDNDGIRDDIQIWIDTAFITDQKLKRGMQQHARALQLKLVKATNKDESVMSTINYLQSSECLSSLVGVYEKMKLANELKKRSINTKERVYAETKSSSHFSGQIYSLTRNAEDGKALCHFEF